MDVGFKSGFVNIFGAPNAGKSTLLNLLLGERLVITSSKVQTTRHRILGILSEPEYQIVFSDTPGIIDPKYKLHEKMMSHVKSALEDADVAIIVHDITKSLDGLKEITALLKLSVPAILLLNKVDKLTKEDSLQDMILPYSQAYPEWIILPISARTKEGTANLIPTILKNLPVAPAFYPDDSISDRNERFFVSELIREQIYSLFDEEIPYHTAVMIQAFEEKSTLTVIKADIIVSRDTQKMILLGKGGSMIKQLGIQSRKNIEEFLQRKVHLELFVKVRQHWRDNENHLREYGYNG
jgi:GTP-binding protein Era